MSLFNPLDELGLKNRCVMAPMTRYFFDEGGCPTELVAEYYIRRAQKGVGLIIVESAAVNQTDAKGYINGCEFHNNKHVLKWQPIIKRIHQTGAKIWIQLFHAGRLTSEEITQKKPLAPSAIPPGNSPSFWRPLLDDEIVNFQTRRPYCVPKEVTRLEIGRILNEFSTAVKLAAQAGFDGVEIHGAHGYLIHQFCSKLSNKRKDEFGLNGSYKFAIDLVRACKGQLNENMYMSYRLSYHMVDNTLIRFNKSDQYLEKLIPLLSNYVDVFHCSQINANQSLFGADEPLHQLVRNLTSKVIIACGGIRSSREANNILKDDERMLVAFGRNFISNPDLIEHFKNGSESEIVDFNYADHMNILY